MNTILAIEHAAKLEAAGMTGAAKALREKADRVRRLAMAYEHFRYVTTEAVTAFMDKLRKSTSKFPSWEQFRAQGGAAWGLTKKAYESSPANYVKPAHDALTMEPAEAYTGLPTAEVLDKMLAAKTLGVFDSFEVAHVDPVASQVINPDPIIFGRITGCTDRFFVAEWGSDVSINDLIGKNDG